MTIFALLNLILYFYIVARTVGYFHHPCHVRREADKVIVAGVGMISAIFVLVQLSIVFGDPVVLQQGQMALSGLLYMFCAANGVLYLSIVCALSRAPTESEVCQTSKRYFP